MKKGIIFPVGRIEVHNEKEGVSIEEQMRKAVEGNEPIQATAHMTYNDRKDGVLAQHDIRTDRFEIAMTATDKVHATEYARRMSADGFEQNDKGEWIAKATGETAGEA